MFFCPAALPWAKGVLNVSYRQSVFISFFWLSIMGSVTVSSHYASTVPVEKVGP